MALDQSEVSNTQFVCNGVNGINGTNGTNGTNGNGLNGVNALIATTVESVGNNCPSGGSKISSGADTNSLLDSTEVTSVSYICNGLWQRWY
jgi:hypothetical protein